MKKKELRGVIPALITPMKEDGRIDNSAMEANVAFLADAGVQGFFVNGTTSEGPILTRAEKRESVRITKEVSAGRQAICAACIAPGTMQVIEEIHEIESAEPDYIVCVTPFYYPVSQKVIIEHYEQICRSTEIPIIFYDIPGQTHNPVAVETRLELLKRGIAAGFKDSTGDFITFSRSVMESNAAEFAWIQGDDLLDAYSIQVGAKGVVTGLSNISPKPYLRLFELAAMGDWAGMIETQKTINKMAGVISAAGGRVIPGIKAAVSYLGRCEPWMRFRGMTATESETAAVRKIIDSLPDSIR